MLADAEAPAGGASPSAAAAAAAPQRFLVAATHSRTVKYIKAVALDVVIVHWRWVHECVRGRRLALLGPFLLPLGFSRQRREWVWPDPETLPPELAGPGGPSGGSGGGGPSGPSGGAGALGAYGSPSPAKRARRLSSASGAALSSGRGFSRAPLRGLALKVAPQRAQQSGAKKARRVACGVRGAGGGGGPPGREGGGGGSETAPHGLPPAQVVGPLAGDWAEIVAAAGAAAVVVHETGRRKGGAREETRAALDAQVCDAMMNEAVQEALGRHAAKVVTFEWVVQCLLHRQRVRDDDFLLRPTPAGGGGGGGQAPAPFIVAPQTVHRVETASPDGSGRSGKQMRFEVGDCVRYLPSASAAVSSSSRELSFGCIVGFHDEPKAPLSNDASSGGEVNNKHCSS